MKKRGSAKTLVAYVTKGGVTEENASLIANLLREKYRLEVHPETFGKIPPGKACCSRSLWRSDENPRIYP